ncbi:DNA alkylation repair protein [Candidatus Curtissbacteria bacterium]|nr:DNA alkylation repair protein [Candidatus Curtissbacteria bacterium]
MIFELRRDLKKLKNKKKAKILARFFKTGKGQYGEGDVFLGITVPQSRKIAQKFKDLSFGEIEKLLRSKIHEERLIALLILVERIQNTSEVSSLALSEVEGGSSEVKRLIFDFYLKNTKYINNWDLVDLSADKIVGGYLINSRHSGPLRPRLSSTQARSEASLSRIKARKLESPASPDPQNDILEKLARSNNLWERRIAIIATFQFIKEKKDFTWTLKIGEMLLSDKHDLIHKAVGWMLREVGKRDQQVEEEFLRKHYKQMPRTMLRYAIERFEAGKKKFYLGK